jgi:hydroxyacid-oxoacid transhydrogenase
VKRYRTLAIPRIILWRRTRVSVILNAPGVFCFTAIASLDRHLQASAALMPKLHGRILADRIIWFMRRLKTPNGLRELGYT